MKDGRHLALCTTHLECDQLYKSHYMRVIISSNSSWFQMQSRSEFGVTHFALMSVEYAFFCDISEYISIVADFRGYLRSLNLCTFKLCICHKYQQVLCEFEALDWF